VYLTKSIFFEYNGAEANECHTIKACHKDLNNNYDDGSSDGVKSTDNTFIYIDVLYDSKHGTFSWNYCIKVTPIYTIKYTNSMYLYCISKLLSNNASIYLYRLHFIV